MLMGARALSVFIASLLLTTWAIQFAGLVFVGDPDDPAMIPYLIGSMFMPAVWSLAYLLVFNRKAWRFVRLWPGNPLWLVLGALLPAMIAFAVLTICEIAGWGSSSYFTFSGTGADILKGPWTLGTGEQDWARFALNMAATALFFAVVNSTVAIGEEFGWRGHLQHHMIARLGAVRGIAVLGVIWAMWHLPMNLAGYNYGQAPLLGALVLFPLQLVAMSFIMAWLTLRARSFWPAVLLHGSGNGIEEGVVSSIAVQAGVDPMTASYLQLGVTILLGLVCLAAMLSQRDSGRAAPAGISLPPD